ncbi:MAG: DEAD/DEAH box helicase family protein [Ruminococcus sp.]|nr:DEAD/DEAH box helicase family protein [Ruminococcus sp.]
MKDFSRVKFNGTFRDYQAKVLENANSHLKDGRIHIVAAPGSGKTILGLELIRGLSAPALVLSPSVIIRQQWGERFEGSFLPESEDKAGYMSYDLKAPALITSITYQALHAAFSKAALEEDDGEAEAEREDFSDFDIMKAVKAAGIRTVCLDEAHLLRSEWQKALEGFLNKLGRGVTIIALTATPPYDSNPAEWKRYYDLCGEIDDEIFVPGLVAQKTLCPHQDYIYFNYPTESELEKIKNQRQKSAELVSELINRRFLNDTVESCGILNDYNLYEEQLFEAYDSFHSLFKICRLTGTELPFQFVSAFRLDGENKYTYSDVEAAFQLVLDYPDIFSAEKSDFLRGILAKNSMIDKGKVCIESSEALEKLLINSIGNLESISTIVRSEYNSLGTKLRMLILTDFIKKDLLGIVGTDEPILSTGTVPIFESVRRSNKDVKLALLSGSLVIVPESVKDQIAAIAEKSGIDCAFSPVKETGCCSVSLSGSNKSKVYVLTEAFQQGLFNVLVGTKALLGEGWDAPCINSLILSSFVGSFMLSNQMRGRAIRTDKNAPDKASNIWHLVTINPEAPENSLSGNDFETVKRRFDCFMAPCYSKNSIESGIDRIDILKPPYNKEGIERINSQMLAIAADREKMKSRWTSSYVSATGEAPRVTEAVETNQAQLPKLSGFKLWKSVIITAVIFLFLLLTVSLMIFLPFAVRATINLILTAVFIPLLIYKIKRCIEFSSNRSAVKYIGECIRDVLVSTGDISSKNSAVAVLENNGGLLCCLRDATSHDERIFSEAISELLSPIDNPRYLIIRGNNPQYSCACPTRIGVKKETAQAFADMLNKNSGDFRVIYTRNELGRKELLSCKQNSFTKQNGKRVKNKRKLT